jgi:soluble lytic murein transglycosylase-like protein/predicted negative regulator of RcsB-dependent stress response
MQRIGRSSAIMPVYIALACWIFVQAQTAAAQAGPFAKNLDVADPAMTLTSAQREAARALGEASRLVESGETVEARQALDRVSGVPQLSGYAELVRVHLLMKEGSHSLAYRTASEALDGPTSDALRAALGVLKGEALAMGGDTSGAELAWNAVLGQPGARDEAVQNSIQLSIVAARQRTGSLDPTRDPQILLDQSYAEVAVASKDAPAVVLPAPLVLSRAVAALEAGRTERAIDLFDEAIAGKLDSDQRRVARMGRAHGLFRARRYQDAVKAFDALLPDVEARFWRARSLARLGDVEGSLEEFEIVTRDSNEEFASWALYLMGTLYEGRDESAKAIGAFRRAAQYERYPDRVRLALWREGWAQYRSNAYADAHATLTQLVERLDDPLAQLRPRYWSARAVARSGNEESGRTELERIARDYPLTYYGWRAQERLSIVGADRTESKDSLAEGTRRIEDDEIERVALLIEADLEGLARDELRFAAIRARGFSDRTRVGFLLARVGDYHRANRLVVNAYEDSLARGLQPGREALWWLSWPPAYRELIHEVFPSGASIDPELVWAIMREESHYRVDARSAVGALGLLQLMPTTAAQLATQQGLDSFETEDLFDPRTNIRLGSAYLAELGTRFNGRMSAAIGSYNAGPNKVSSWLRGADGRLEDDVWVEDIPYDQTRGYVKRVLRSLHVYKVFYRTQ